MRIGFIQKVGLVLLVPVCGALLTIGIFSYYLASSSLDEHIINVAGRQRMLSQRIFAYTSLVYSGDEKYRIKLQDSIKLFDDSMHTLESGGNAMGRELPAAPERVHDDIQQAKSLWMKLKKEILFIAVQPTGTSGITETFASVKENINLLTVYSDHVVTAFENASQRRQKTMLNVIIVVAIADILLLIMGVLVTRRYVAERSRNEQALIASEKEWRQTFDAIPDLVSLHDSNFRILRANKALADFVDVKPEELIGKHCYEIFHHTDQPHENCPLVKTLSTKRATTENIDDPHIGIPLQITTSPVLDDEGEVVASVHVASDISERRNYEERLQRLANMDTLTGLPNRALFFDRLKQGIIHARRQQHSLAILFLDLDQFKNINDTLGHVMGDDLLKDVADCLKKCVRSGDTVARHGGDEFVILLSDIRYKEDAALVAQKMIDSLIRPFVENDHQLFISASIGISIYPDDGEDDLSLIRHADMAMYRAKDMGRNNFQFYQQDMGDRASERLAMESSLRKALQNKEFMLFYQPKMDLTTGRICGVEALIRWQHPERGMILPGQFIPLLEETNMICSVGQWVLHEACQQQKRWQESGLPELTIAVNLSARQFVNVDLPAQVLEILENTGLDPRLLELEITESILMEHKKTVITALHDLNAMGIQLSIDDFGTGYSSLNYLKRFPIHTLKIDRSFINDLPHDHDDVAITLAVIAMAKNLNLKVVAEGVETSEQLTFLIEHRCDEIQGYYISEPVPAEKLTRMLEQDKADTDAGKDNESNNIHIFKKQKFE